MINGVQDYLTFLLIIIFCVFISCMFKLFLKSKTDQDVDLDSFHEVIICCSQ